MTTKLTTPGQNHTATAGRLTLVAQIGQDGCFSINAFAGPHRVDALCFAFTNRLDAAEVYRDIRDGGLAFMTDADIAEKVRERLVDIAAQHRGRPGQTPRVAELDRALDRVEPLAFTSALADAPARTWADLRDEFAAGFARAS